MRQFTLLTTYFTYLTYFKLQQNIPQNHIKYNSLYSLCDKLRKLPQFPMEKSLNKVNWISCVSLVSLQGDNRITKSKGGKKDG